MYRSVLEYKIGVGQDILRSVNGSDHVVGRQAGVPVEMERPGWGSIMRPALQQAGFSAFGKSRRPRSRVSKTGTWTDAYPSRAAVESKPEACSLQAKKLIAGLRTFRILKPRFMVYKESPRGGIRCSDVNLFSDH